jgi:predicted PurR-regulated permease PerM
MDNIDMNHKNWIMVGALTLLALVYMLYPFAGLLVYSVFVYYIARPVYSRLLAKVNNKSICAFASLFLVALPIVLIITYTIGVAAMDMQNFLSTTDIPSLQSSEALINETGRFVGDISTFTTGVTTSTNVTINGSKTEGLLSLTSGQGDLKGRIIQALPGALGSVVMGMVSVALEFLFSLFLILVISFYLLIDGEVGIRWLEGTVFPNDGSIDAFISGVDEDLSTIFLGSILNAGVVAVVGALLFTIVNNTSSVIAIPYPVLLGILCGITSLIPIAGGALVYIPLAIYLLIKAAAEQTFGLSVVSIILFTAACYAIVDWLPNNILKPMITSRKIHKGLLLLSYIFGPAVFGLKGLFLGPMILVVAVRFADIVLPKLTGSEHRSIGTQKNRPDR